MQHIHFRVFFALTAGIILFSSCKETTVSSGAPGDIIGSVQVYDTNYVLMTDMSGVKVSLEGTSYSTLSDASGKWHLTNIPAGTYILVFSKEGYGTWKKQNFEFTGNGTYYYTLGFQPTSIYPVPNIYPDIVTRTFTSTFNGHYDTSAIFSTRSTYLYHGVTVWSMLLFGKKGQKLDPTIPNSYLFNVSDLSSAPQDTSGNDKFTIEKSDLLKSGFSSGDSIYCCAYATTSLILWVDNWYDPASGKYIYSGFSPNRSEVKSFILP